MTPEYLILEENVGVGNLKSAECINSYMSVLSLKREIEKLQPQIAEKNLLIFSQVTLLIKMWAKRRGIYNYNLGYLNGISIMILVVKAMQQFYYTQGKHHVRALILNHFSHFRQLIVEFFFNLYADWPWDDVSFKDRAVQLVDIDFYIMENEMRCTTSISELQNTEFLH